MTRRATSAPARASPLLALLAALLAGRAAAQQASGPIPAAALIAAGETKRAPSKEDTAQLLAFKASFENGEQVLDNWQPGTDPCAWTGISCGDTGVESLCAGEGEGGARRRARVPRLLGFAAQHLLPWCSAIRRGCCAPALSRCTAAAPTTGPCRPACSVVIDKGLRGAIPPGGWKLPATIKDISLGNTQTTRLNQIRGPIPPEWELPSSALGRLRRGWSWR